MWPCIFPLLLVSWSVMRDCQVLPTSTTAVRPLTTPISNVKIHFAAVFAHQLLQLPTAWIWCSCVTEVLKAEVMARILNEVHRRTNTIIYWMRACWSNNTRSEWTFAALKSHIFWMVMDAFLRHAYFVPTCPDEPLRACVRACSPSLKFILTAALLCSLALLCFVCFANFLGRRILFWSAVLSLGETSSFSSFSAFLSRSLLLTGEFLDYMTFLSSKHRGSHIPFSWMVQADCVFHAGIHPPGTWIPVSFESVW